jgi:predicted dehydrogenase/aryl-alcohol dehydrogenase-like predicted oxidoreductase
MLRWGIIGTGSIARAFASALARSKTGTLHAAGSRTLDRAAAFAGEYGAPRSYGGYDELLADGEVDAVYISTPHPMHPEWAIRAAEAGKSVLCEKPLALNHSQAMTVVEAARRTGVFLMEAFMYRCHPQTARLVELVRDGAVGEVRVIQATFSFHADVPPEHRLANPELGGGGILDVGCYCVSLSRLIAGAARGQSFAEPIDVLGRGHIGATGVDDWAAATLRFPGDILAQLSTGVRLNQENVVRIFGSEGWILVPNPWIPAREGGVVQVVLHRYDGAEPETIEVVSDRWLYEIEADVVAANVANGQPPAPCMTWDDTLGNMQTLDRWRAQIGLVYPGEAPDDDVPPVAGRPLRVREADRTAMRYGRLDGIDIAISRLVMGVDNQSTLPHAAAMFDDFYERGGNCFDTAWIYGGGSCERLLGRWIAMRGLRDKVVVLDKGAHTPFCTPEHLVRQLDESLERLGTEFVDLYLMHRDNPDVPAGEFVSVLNDLRSQGKLRVFGGSNWTMERLQEANTFAAENGLEPFRALSNNLSLARMIEPVWAGCITASTPEWLAWLEETQLALFSWSSQARGFFARPVHPDDRSDAELARCWFSDENFARLERARELANRRGCLPINIALAYVLCQPFPTYALIGPRTIEETTTSLPALGIELSGPEIRWLETGSEDGGR